MERKDWVRSIQTADRTHRPKMLTIHEFTDRLRRESSNAKWKKTSRNLSSSHRLRTSRSCAGTQGYDKRYCKGLGQFPPAKCTCRTSAAGKKGRYRQPRAIQNHGRACE